MAEMDIGTCALVISMCSYFVAAKGYWERMAVDLMHHLVMT